MTTTPLTAAELDALRALWDEVVAARDEEGVTANSDRGTWSLMTARTSRAEGKAADALPRLLATVDALTTENADLRALVNNIAGSEVR